MNINTKRSGGTSQIHEDSKQQDQNIYGWAEHHNKEGNPNKITERDPTLTKEKNNQENPVKQQKSTQQKKHQFSAKKNPTIKINIKAKLLSHQNLQKNKTAIPKPPDSVTPTP